MYKISDFSKITNLTIKALRYYDEEGILIPSHRNNQNSYRFYDENDFQKAILIATLRALDFSISEIKDVLANCDNTDDLSYYLEEKKSRIESKISKEKELIRKITLYMKPKNMEDISMNYKIEAKKFAPVTVASICYKGKYSDVGMYIGKIYKAVKNNGAGAPFNCYYDAEFKEEADIKLCAPTTQLINNSSISAKKLPAIKAICTTHTGSYDKLNLAYKALLDYANEHNINCLTPSREVYIKGPGMVFRGNENNYITEIIIPFEEV
ncbi:MAG: MerR family transcriptional regulator [Ruminiclostridium sp.]